MGMIHGIAFRNRSSGLAVGADDTLLRTANGGLTWEAASAPVNSRLNAVQYSSRLRAFASGDDGVVLRTQNGGLNWTRISKRRSRTRGGLDASARFVWLGGRGRAGR